MVEDKLVCTVRAKQHLDRIGLKRNSVSRVGESTSIAWNCTSPSVVICGSFNQFIANPIAILRIEGAGVVAFAARKDIGGKLSCDQKSDVLWH